MSVECPFCGASVEIDELSENDGACGYCDHRLLPLDFDYDSADEEAVLAELITDEDEALDDDGFFDLEDLDDDSVDEEDDEDDEERFSGIAGAEVVDDADPSLGSAHV